jgi:hypothetical protein
MVFPHEFNWQIDRSVARISSVNCVAIAGICAIGNGLKILERSKKKWTWVNNKNMLASPD